MVIPFNRKSTNCYAEVFRTTYECRCSAECVVPDVQEDISRILTTNYLTKIRSKDADFERINVKGELAATVIYASENGVEKLDVTMPLNADIPAPETDSSCIINADMKLLSCELHMINPRKISLNAAVLITTASYQTDTMEWFEAPESLPASLMTKSEAAEAAYIGTVSEKTFVVEEEYDMEESGEIKLVSAFSSYSCDGCENVGEKMIVRGHSDIECLYLCGNKLKHKRFSEPFSQLFDVGSDKSVKKDLIILPTGEYYDITDGHLTAELHAVMQLVTEDFAEISYVSDTYSCKNTLDVTYELLNINNRAKAESFSDTVQLTYDAGENISEILYIGKRIGKIEKGEEKISVPLIADVIYITDNGDICARKLRGNAEFLSDGIQISRVNAELAEPHAVTLGSKIDLQLGVKLITESEEEKQISMISEIAEGEVFTKGKNCVYLVRGGESLWETAKKYKSSPDIIAQINNLDDGKTDGKLLLVPEI